MNTIKSIIVALFFSLCFNISAQKLTENQKLKESNRVRVYSFEELDNIQMMFQEGMLEMELTNDLEEEYVNLIVAYTAKMSRLDDLDNAYTKEEINNYFLVYLDKIETQVKLILSIDQYKKHLMSFNIIKDSILLKLLEV